MTRDVNRARPRRLPTPGIDLQAAVLLQSLVGNQSLVDGNKRLGWLATVVVYALNDVLLDAPDDAAYEPVMVVAQGDVDIEHVAATLGSWH